MPHVRNFLNIAKKQIKQRSSCPRLQAHSPSFSQLFSSRIKQVATGFEFTEGPIWVQDKLLFSDIPASKIYCLTPQRRRRPRVSVFRSPSGHANGLTLDFEGRLIACEHDNRRVTRTEADGSITVLAEVFAGKPLNSPNDVVVHSNGAIYFTDPPYGIQPHQQEQPVQGVYRIDISGQLALVATDFDRPNGLAFSKNERLLYIDDSSKRRHVRRFDVDIDGMPTGGEVFCTMTDAGVPDGMKLDPSGNVYCTGPGGVWVWNSAGVLLGRIMLPEQPSNCAWGDADYHGLYITAQRSVYYIRCCQAGWVPHITANNP